MPTFIRAWFPFTADEGENATLIDEAKTHTAIYTVREQERARLVMA